MDEITITKEQLQGAFQAWEADYRAGKTMTVEDAASLPAEEIAQRSAEHMWSLLTPKTVAHN